jgi:hypothetical protein
MEIEKVLVRLRETTSEINTAAEDPRMKVTLEKTWLLQDRLVIPEQVCNLTRGSFICMLLILRF